MSRKLTFDEAVKLNEKYKASGLTQKAFAQAEGISIYKISLCRHIIQQKNPKVTLPKTNLDFTEVKLPDHKQTQLSNRSGVSIRIGEFAIDLEQSFDSKALSKVIGVLNKGFINVQLWVPAYICC